MNIALIFAVIIGLPVICIILKSLSNINKIQCPKCNKNELEQACYNSNGKCSCGYSEDINELNRRLKEIHRYA